MTILETERLWLRHLIPEDLDPLWALYQDPEVSRYIPDAPRTRDEASAELDWHRHGHPRHPELGLWATIHKGSGAFIGRCGLLPWTLAGVDEVEIAYLIARSHWGQGLATEAALAVRDHAYETLGHSRLICLVDEGNLASIRVARKLGMEFERSGVDEIGPYQLFSVSR